MQTIPVRHIDYDGGLSYHYLNIDGTEPEEYREVTGDSYRSSSIFSDRYKLSIHKKIMPERVGFLRKMLANLKFLCEHDPLLFEEFLVFCENMSDHESVFVAQLLDKRTTPDTPSAIQRTLARYRAIMSAAPVLTDMLRYEDDATRDVITPLLFSNALKSVKDATHPHLQATAVALWITTDFGGNDSTPQYYEQHRDEITFIHDHLSDVLASSHVLKQAGTIDKQYVSDVISHKTVLRSGVL